MTTRTVLGAMPDGRAVHGWQLGHGDSIAGLVSSYGAAIQSLVVPVRHGRRNVIVGHAAFADYLAPGSLRSAVVGRYANRIAGARFSLGGREYRLESNEGGNTLHGGSSGFDRALWSGEAEGDTLVLRHESPDGEAGFPGHLRVEVRYRVEGDGLVISYSATTDAATPVNLTNHAYFNLAGQGDVLDHSLMIPAEFYLPVDEVQIPTGEMRPVAGTPFDFRQPRPIGERIGTPDAQLAIGRGYDHCFVLPPAAPGLLRQAARLGVQDLSMEVHTTEPGMQLYTGNNASAALAKHGAVCLETQGFPNSVNQPGFPDTVLMPGAVFRSTTSYTFGD